MISHLRNPVIRLGLAISLIAGLVYAYLPNLLWLGQQWMGPDQSSGRVENWSHGPVLVVLISYVLLRRRGELLKQTASSLRGTPLLVVGLVLHAAGASLNAPSISAYSLFLSRRV